ncbi:Putative SOS response-associated peptidase (modular protein) [Arthrobacter sp. 9V]|uniref:SOS response-associated peptidase n=1 Tax=Arthrobacter sp. 9V TaxID=2653132 RepID=UPI0012F1A587|nr:SOS response-associated peptidase [Arthrobacter sp. 9V]VXC47491.1 Putative SOS response-associated peptidase (modular protein) [Arthrobacter sp. 9V]
MCGRYVMSKATSDLLSHFEAKEVDGSPPGPSWNVAPTQNVPIVAERLDEGTLDRRLLVARWGLVPSWAKDTKIGSKMINARSETILEKPSFRSAAVKRRAILPAEGYYEWQKPRTGRRSRTICSRRKSRCWASPACTSSGPIRSCPRTIPNGGY